MFVPVFVVSVLLALAVSYGISRLSTPIVETILARYLVRNVSYVTSKYLQLTVLLVGVSSGARIHLLEDYLGAPSWNKPALDAQLTPELWTVAMYHTATNALLGILWFLIVFAFLALMAVTSIRRTNVKWLMPEREPLKPPDSPATVKPIR